MWEEREEELMENEVYIRNVRGGNLGYIQNICKLTCNSITNHRDLRGDDIDIIVERDVEVVALQQYAALVPVRLDQQVQTPNLEIGSFRGRRQHLRSNI